MKATILLDRTENLRQVETEEKNRFLRDVLVQSGVPIEDFWEFDQLNLSLEQKMKLLHVLSFHGIEVLDDQDGTMEIYFQKGLVARWNKCTYKIKRDLSQKNPKKQLYIEMYIEIFNIFSEETASEEEK